MPAYVIGNIEVTDPELYEDYKALVPASLEPYDGRFVVRGGELEPLEGDWLPKRFVVLEFPSLERARAWFDSADYQAAAAIRRRASRGTLLLVDGA